MDRFDDGGVILGGLYVVFIGIVEEFGNGPRILYSRQKILTILCERDNMTISEAAEFYDYNIIGLYAGEQNPVFLISE